MTYPKLRVSRLVGESVVNAVLLKLCLELFPSRYNPSAMNINKDTIYMATIQWTINATITGRDLFNYQCQHGHKQLIDQCHNQDTIHMATLPWTINAITNGRDLISYGCQHGH